ncbi:MAG TPA: hypothetical protein VHY83_08730 [Solirubrobacteraceae bacterium]|jgi:hypothetical protein|nr:hypothetical protein [Solirubrobacteraceae bacterium]
MFEESTTRVPAELARLAFEAGNQRDIDAVMSFVRLTTHADIDEARAAAERLAAERG